MIDARTPGWDGAFDITTLPGLPRFSFSVSFADDYRSWQFRLRADEMIGLSVLKPNTSFVGGWSA